MRWLRFRHSHLTKTKMNMHAQMPLVPQKLDKHFLPLIRDGIFNNTCMAVDELSRNTRSMLAYDTNREAKARMLAIRTTENSYFFQ